MGRIVYVNGAYVPEEEAKISIFDRGFIFADGIYEVSAVINGKLVDYDAHMERLKRSLGEIRISGAPDRAALDDMHRQLIARNRLHEGWIYMQITRGAADRDFKFPKDAQPTLVAFTQTGKLVVSSTSALDDAAVLAAVDEAGYSAVRA